MSYTLCFYTILVILLFIVLLCDNFTLSAEVQSKNRETQKKIDIFKVCEKIKSKSD